MKVLVTGGAGYIGSHACLALAAKGVEPVTLDSLITGHAWAVQWGPLARGDVRDSDFVAELIEKHKIEAVLHFAALSLVAQSVAEPLRYYDNNVAGTLALLAAMKRCNLRKLVFSSTCAVYGVPPALPIREDMPTAPINPYGRTKLAAENAIMDAAQAGEIDAVILRYFNAAGADAQLRIGEAHVHESHLIPLAIHAARLKGEPLKVFGTDYDTPDGTCLRDYVHVTDLADAHAAALDFILGSKRGHRFNLGTGKPASVRQVLTAVEQAMGRPVPHTEAPRRAGDPMTLYAANDLARDKLGWQPRHLDIVEIVKSAVAWDAKYASSFAASA
ncbi:UDP-glucose 4-epimerase GalE [Dongia sp.]|uniref:UDP-glucose 4-epimerase GalE n=1 Tax=Dongia sp. TaxID=1977262 RepID=UPI0035B344EE